MSTILIGLLGILICLGWTVRGVLTRKRKIQKLQKLQKQFGEYLSEALKKGDYVVHKLPVHKNNR